jgi:glycine cleavage system H protein
LTSPAAPPILPRATIHREPIVSNVPDDLVYTTEHEYVQRTGDPAVVRVGITDYAQGELGDVVFVNLPKPGETLASHQSFGTIEAVKAVSELYSPLAGEVVEVNGALERDPAVVNRDPYGEGWMVSLRLADSAALGGLLSPAAYRAHIGE